VHFGRLYIAVSVLFVHLANAVLPAAFHLEGVEEVQESSFIRLSSFYFIVTNSSKKTAFLSVCLGVLSYLSANKRCHQVSSFSSLTPWNIAAAVADCCDDKHKSPDGRCESAVRHQAQEAIHWQEVTCHKLIHPPSLDLIALQSCPYISQLARIYYC